MITFDDQKETFSKFTPIEKYKFLEKLRSVLRDIQQLSYRITQFDKRFPLENSKDIDYDSLLDSYLKFSSEIDDIAMWVREDEMRNKHL